MPEAYALVALTLALLAWALLRPRPRPAVLPLALIAVTVDGEWHVHHGRTARDVYPTTEALRRALPGIARRFQVTLTGGAYVALSALPLTPTERKFLGLPANL
jgi:hypothetical protein